MAVCGMLLRIYSLLFSSFGVLFDFNRRSTSWCRSCKAHRCHWICHRGAGADPSWYQAKRCRYSVLWLLDVSRRLQNTCPAFVWHLPSSRSLRLCVIRGCCAFDSACAYLACCRLAEVDWSCIDGVNRWIPHSFVDRPVEDLVEMVLPSRKRDASEGPSMNRLYAAWPLSLRYLVRNAAAWRVLSLTFVRLVERFQTL